MRQVKLSELPWCEGRDLLMVAQKHGVKLLGGDLDGMLTTMFGLADMLAKTEAGREMFTMEGREK